MDLISQRVASGLDVKPTALRKLKTTKTQNIETGEEGAIKSSRDGKPVDWKKWGDRAAIGKAWADDSKRLFTGNEVRYCCFLFKLAGFIVGDSGDRLGHGHHEIRSSLMRLCCMVCPVRALRHTVSYPNSALFNIHNTVPAFPAQHTSAPGLITLTPITLFFTPLMSTTAKITIPLSDLRGVKKTGLLKGLSLRWTETLADESVFEKEEKFIWVGDRDELFARLIGPDGRRWLKV